MSLRFDANPPIYDFGKNSVAFMATTGSREVRFRVTRHALASMMKRKTSSEAEMMAAYKFHAERIHRIAERKYDQHQIDTDGTVLVIQRDVS